LEVPVITLRVPLPNAVVAQIPADPVPLCPSEYPFKASDRSTFVSEETSVTLKYGRVKLSVLL